MKIVVLHVGDEHYRMIKQIAVAKKQSIEKWILQSTECSLRTEAEQLADAVVPIDFNTPEIDAVITAIG